MFSILPGLGFWMLLLGLLLIAYDVPFLRRPMARLTIWATREVGRVQGMDQAEVESLRLKLPGPQSPKEPARAPFSDYRR